MPEHEDLWSSISERFRDHVGEAAWKTWFISITPVMITTDEVVLATPSPLAKERLETKYREVLGTLFSEALGHQVPVRIQVRANESVTFPAEVSAGESRERDLFGSDPNLSRQANSKSRLSSAFDPRYTFEAFVIGSSNRFAHAASLAVAETPAASYNPLFIHGGAGLGKTHLLHAIGNYLRHNYRDKYVKYVSTETFLNEFVDAIQRNKTSDFKARYRECDVLLVDDIQFLQNKEAIQEEFFHTFNYLYGAQKQIVLTSDRSPKAIATLEERLRSRFAMGLITDVQPPDLETRSAILQRKAEDSGFRLDLSIIELIATNITDNIRELEGALTRLSAYSSLNQVPITLDLAQIVLSDLISSTQRLAPRDPREIITVTATFFNTTPVELLGQSRKRPIAIARQIAMYIMRELTELSYPEIGREFGGRDHTTVIHAVQKVQNVMQTSIETFEQVDQLFKLLRDPARQRG
ncbi:chromosomal replication initiator protein DnaA [Ferrimicrobium acidiphilum]|uniref:Chromosomal replication initiator protein DnaA n=1 Tax=Ferrimicrobium acidiphilum DSM 19497 TaxID=1121877 RepID=A0A0D8FTJ1_9ACTN|nr:chromosomal replication initiator protein DnaA [Ferrimicrobium acidiphilum]KJE76441.1 chromosomal replication initiator protein DnaA [Ferrimicrobium acidiphilum DSM 19497]MCL5052778.1 chromosomal replication initiator protein DnaA [Gammaproteobacteria bacterium]